MNNKHLLIITILPLLLLIPFTFTEGAPRQSEKDYVKWGMQAWDCGQSIFSIRIGDPKDVITIKEITGFIAASAPPSSNDALVRNALVSVFYEWEPTPGNVKITNTPKSANHSIDNNLFSINIKQKASTTPHLPIHIKFDKGVVIPNGDLNTSMKIQTYSIYTDLSGTECLDVEMHLTVFYTRQ